MGEAFSNRPTTVADYLAILRRRKWIVLLPPVWAAVVAYLLSTGQSPVYRATSQVLLDSQTIVELCDRRRSRQLATRSASSRHRRASPGRPRWRGVSPPLRGSRG